MISLITGKVKFKNQIKSNDKSKNQIKVLKKKKHLLKMLLLDFLYQQVDTAPQQKSCRIENQVIDI